MLIYLITSLPKLSINSPLLISITTLTKHIYETLPENILYDFNLLVDMHKQELAHKKSLIKLDKFDDNTSFKRSLLTNIQNKTRNTFLKHWTKANIDLQDVITGLLCKKKNLTKAEAKLHFSANQSSIARFIINHYEMNDLGISKRFTWFNEISSILKINDLEKVEKSIDYIKLKIIHNLKDHTIFHINTIFSYYLELSILERHFYFNHNLGKNHLKTFLDSIII